jgi:hypothetical protein
MVWDGVWSLKVDGTQLHDPASGYFAEIPEWDTGSDDEVILVAIDGSAPAYIRNQPKEATYTLLLAHAGCDWAAWDEYLAWIRSACSRGPHILTAKVRGMADEADVPVVVRGMMVAAKERRIVVSLVVPKPYPV